MSRAEYMKNRRDKMFIFYAQIEKEYETKMNKILEKESKTKTDWLREKIEENYKKL